jgi:hypothetical protein
MLYKNQAPGIMLQSATAPWTFITLTLVIIFLYSKVFGLTTALIHITVSITILHVPQD